MDPLLFQPITIRGVTIRNRIALSPMLTYAAKNGHISDWHFAHYAKYAVGGTGMIMYESTKPDPRGCTTSNDCGLWKDDFIAPLKRIVDFSHDYGATIGIQLGHSGRKARNALPWEGRQPREDLPGVDHGEPWEIVAPSAIPHGPGYGTPRALSASEIVDVIEMYGRAAERALKAGFDILEIHGAHGYLAHQFLSEGANRRNDGYGGTLHNRMRFAVEVTERVRQVWPDDKPLFYRTSAVDEDSWTIEDSIELAKVLKTKGVDVFDCSSGGMSQRSPTEPVKPHYGYQVPYARAIREGAGIATMAVGLIVHADQAEGILQDGSADIVALGREMLYNPHWPIDAAAKLGMTPPLKDVPTVYGWWLAKRTQSKFGNPSTMQDGIKA